MQKVIFLLYPKQDKNDRYLTSYILLFYDGTCPRVLNINSKLRVKNERNRKFVNSSPK